MLYGRRLEPQGFSFFTAVKISITLMNCFSDIYNKINESDIGHRIASGAFWSMVGTALSKVFVLIGGMFCARILGKEGFGEFGMIRSTISMFVVFGTAGLGLTATKHIAEFRKSAKEKIPSIYLLTNGFAIVTGGIVVILVLLLSDYLVYNTLNSPQLLTSLRFGALLLFVTVLNGAQFGTLSGFENFKAIAHNNIIGGIAETVFMLLGAYFYGVEGAVLGFGMGFVFLFIANQCSINTTFKHYGIKIDRKLFDRHDLKLLYKFSLPAMLSSLLVTPVMWGIRAILVNHDNFGELANFEIATQWRLIILFIPSAVGQIVLPILSSINSSDSQKFLKVLKYNLMLNVGISFSVALLVFIFSPLIVSFYGEDFTNPYPLIILAFSTVFSSIASVVGMSIQSRAKIWSGFMFNLLWATMVSVFSYVFVNNGYGATGLSIAITLSYLVHSILQLLYLKKTIFA